MNIRNYMAKKRKNISSGAKWENIVGYSRAVVLGKTIEVSGTVAVDKSGRLVGKGNYYKQSKFILEKIEKVLRKAGFSMKDVVRTRMFVRDIRKWHLVGKAHGEFFSKIKPATSMIEISSLIDPLHLVEIEVTARKA